MAAQDRRSCRPVLLARLAALALLISAGTLVALVSTSSAEPQPSPTEQLAVGLPSGLTPGNLAALRGLRQAVLESKHADQFVKNRTFGVNGTGQETVFLQEQLDAHLPELRPALRRLAAQLDESAGWGALPGADGPALTMRCVELLRYSGGATGTEGVGWHADGATLMTMVILLSDPEEFSGGAVEFRRSTAADAVTDERFELRAGDALGWRGWTSHRVAPLTRGVREVFVVEWWVGEVRKRSTLHLGNFCAQSDRITKTGLRSDQED